MMASQFSDKKYTTICSEKTLQANTNGFFMDFVKLVRENAGEKWIKNVFGKLKSDREMIRIIYDYEMIKKPVIHFLSNVQEIFREKNAEISQAKRLEGEKLYKNGELQKALMFFSQSILRAPKTGVNKRIDCGSSLSLALWGRAQVFLELKEYSFALTDIQLALKESIPNIYKAEAYWKMGTCYNALKEENRANVAYALAEKLLTNKLKLEELMNDTKKKFNPVKTESRRVLPSVLGEHHDTFSCASKKLTVKQKDGMGRFVVANTEIKTGETLVVEPPYAACLLPDMFGTHCHHCFDRLIAPIGCTNCSNVAFCKQQCQQEALSTYHKYECKFLDLLIGSGMSILSHTALRMITQNSLKRCLEIYNDRSKEKAYSLCTNAGIRPAEDFLQRTLMAAFLLRCLQKSGYFQSGGYVTPTEEEYCVGELLLFHLQMLQFNAHEIYETRNATEHRFKGSKPVYIGVAVYPTVALFNHDCYPAVIRYFVGKNIVIKAIRPLQSQEVVAENYGPIFTRMCLKERQRSLLSRYWFTCQCQACTLNWPTLTDLEDYSRRVKCATEDCLNNFTLPLLSNTLKCPKCDKTVPLSEYIKKLEWCEDQYKIGIEAMHSNQPEKAIQILCPALDIFHRISSPPHKSTHLAQDSLQLCSADSGNVYQVFVKK